MGYQESFLYIEPQWKFEKLIRTYEKAEQAGYKNGYRHFVEITVAGGKITAVNWDAYKEDSKLTKKQESKNGTYVMTETGKKWHEQAEILEG